MRRIALSIAFIFSIGLVYGADSTEYQRVSTRMRDVMEPRRADGSRPMNKQFRRWEWFWQGRIQQDGTFPTSEMYLRENTRINNAKVREDLQAAKVWKELGPMAPDLPSGSSSWYGIGRVNCIEVSRQNPDLLYVGSASGGVWKSTNAGSSWTYVDITIVPVVGVSDIAMSATDDKVMYVATGDANGATPGDLNSYNSFSYGLVKTTDGGATWATTNLQFAASDNAVVSRLWVDPRDANVVVAATYSGMYRTTDGGAAWTKTNTGLFRDMIGKPNNPDVLYSTTYAYRGGAKIFRSVNAGRVWEEVFNITRANRIRLAVTKANVNVVGALASDFETQGLEGVYKSDDGGDSFGQLFTNLNLLDWSHDGRGPGVGGNLGQGFYDLAMEISPTNANHLYVGGVNIWRTTTNGQSWILSAYQSGGYGASLVHADQHFFKFHPSRNVIYSTHDGGVARSTDAGISWRDMSNGLRIQQYYGLATSNINPSLTISGAQDNGTVLSTNSGSTFKKVLDGDGMMTAIDYIDPQLMYGSRYNGDFFRSTNQGANWVFSISPAQKGEDGAWVSPIAADPKNNNVAYIGYTQVYKTTSGGTFWSKISSIAISKPARFISVSPSDQKYIYVSYDTELFSTSNGGTTWQRITGVASYIMSLDVHPTDPTTCYVAVGGYSGGIKVLKSTKGVVTNLTGDGLPNVPCNSVVYQSGARNRIFAGTDLGVFVSDEGSNYWQRYGVGMPNVIVTAMRFITSSNILRVSTYGRGTWEVDATQCIATTPTVNASTPTTQCSGDSVVLEASSGFASYRWSNGDTTKRIVLRTVGQTGAYSVNVEDNAGCRSSSVVTQVTLKQAPVKPNISKRGLDTLRSSAVGGITDFQWFRDGTAISGATSRDLFTRSSGTYTVRVRNAVPCSAMSSDYVFVYDPTSVEEDVAAGRAIGISPNPGLDFVIVAMPLSSQRTLDVVNLVGQTVYSTHVADGQRELRLNLATFARGAYIVRVSSETSVWMERLVRE